MKNGYINFALYIIAMTLPLLPKAKLGVCPFLPEGIPNMCHLSDDHVNRLLVDDVANNIATQQVKAETDVNLSKLAKRVKKKGLAKTLPAEVAAEEATVLSQPLVIVKKCI